MHASVTPGSVLELPWNPAFNALAYVLAGDGTAGPTANLYTPVSWCSLAPASG